MGVLPAAINHLQHIIKHSDELSGLVEERISALYIWRVHVDQIRSHNCLWLPIAVILGPGALQGTRMFGASFQPAGDEINKGSVFWTTGSGSATPHPHSWLHCDRHHASRPSP